MYEYFVSPAQMILPDDTNRVAYFETFILRRHNKYPEDAAELNNLRDEHRELFDFNPLLAEHRWNPSRIHFIYGLLGPSNHDICLMIQNGDLDDRYDHSHTTPASPLLAMKAIDVPERRLREHCHTTMHTTEECVCRLYSY